MILRYLAGFFLIWMFLLLWAVVYVADGVAGLLKGLRRGGEENGC